MTADEYLAERFASLNWTLSERGQTQLPDSVLNHEIRIAFLAGAASAIRECSERLKAETDTSYRCPVHRADLRCHRTVGHEGECVFDLNEAL